MRFWPILFLLTSTLFGAEVIRVGASQRVIAISQDITRQWKLNDRVCVVQEQKEIDCGVIVKSKEAFAIVRLKEGSTLIGRGDKVITDIHARRPATLLQGDSATTVPIERFPFHNLSGGVSVGTGFYFPLLHFQRILDPKFAMGLMPSYIKISSGSGSLNSISMLLTGNYYFNEFFRGLWLQVGGGLTFLSSTVGITEEQATSFNFLTTAGWRMKTDMGINVGIAGGFQYLKDPDFTSVTLSGLGLQPLILVDVGISF